MSARACTALAAVAAVAALGAVRADAPCPARTPQAGAAGVAWIVGPDEDRAVLEQWCRGVGPPVYVPRPVTLAPAPPTLEALVVVTWNAHLAEGRLFDLVAALRSGALTGTPVAHFVLLVQELFRRGPEVPAFAPDVRSARAIRARDPASADVRGHAASLGLSVLYVPAMRNGAAVQEDRGNAILSSEPLFNAASIELPFERQRRVAVAAAIRVGRGQRDGTLHVVNTHLEPLSSPARLWFFHNPRPRQMAALLGRLTFARSEDDQTWSGAILGGDFNTVKHGVDEGAYRAARAWGRNTAAEDPRPTHLLGRLDYLVFRLPDGWSGTTVRAADRFGSDHYPVVGTFRHAPAESR